MSKWTIRIWPTGSRSLRPLEKIEVEDVRGVYRELDKQPPSNLTGRMEVQTPGGKTVVIKEK
jgi:hypothetical protein